MISTSQIVAVLVTRLVTQQVSLLVIQLVTQLVTRWLVSFTSVVGALRNGIVLSSQKYQTTNKAD